MTDGTTENTAPENVAPLTTEEVLQTTPDPEQIKQQVEGQVRIMQAGMTLGFLTQQVQGVLTQITANNPRLAYAVTNELQMIYSEAMRRSIQIVDNTKPAAAEEAPAANDAEAQAADAANG